MSKAVEGFLLRDRVPRMEILSVCARLCSSRSIRFWVNYNFEYWLMSLFVRLGSTVFVSRSETVIL